MKKFKDPIETTDEWELYEKAVDTLHKMDVFQKHKRHNDFYHSMQWEGIDFGDMSPVCYNIIRPIVKYKVGVVVSGGYKICYNPMPTENESEHSKFVSLCDALSRHGAVVWEKEKMDKKIRNVIKSAAIDGEGIIYFDYRKNEIVSEVIEKTNVFYALETTSDIERQPYILITFRKSVNEVKNEARQNGIAESEIEKIIADDEVAPNKTATDKENCEMCLCILKMYKKDGEVYVKKSTRTCVYEKERSTGLSRYPVAHFVWEETLNSARGIGEVEGLVPNQIEINKTAMRRSIAVRMGAYPKLVVAKNLVTNEQALTQVGSTIFVATSPLDNVRSAVDYLTPSSMSPDSANLQNELISLSRELSGAGDIATGEINPEKASGKAILAVKQSSEQPLSEQVDLLKDFVENIALIFYDMWKTFADDKKMLYSISDEHKAAKPNMLLNKRMMAKNAPSVAVDISPSTPFDKFAREQSLENMLSNGHISFEEYVDALAFDSVMPKEQLKAIIAKRKEEQKRISQIEMKANELSQRNDELFAKNNNLNSSKEEELPESNNNQMQFDKGTAQEQHSQEMQQ